MKKRLLFVLATLLIFGSGKAQQQPTHYPFNYHDFPNTMTAIIQIQINGVEQTSSELELGAFNRDMITGAERIGCYGSHGYYRVYLSVYGSSGSYEVTFKLYNHQTEEELDNCVITYQGEPYTFTWVSDTGIGSNKIPIVLNFITGQSFTKEITGYGTGTGKWYLIASPLADETNPEDVGEMLNNSYDLYRFNQSAQANDQGLTLEWENWKQEEGGNYHFNLEAGKGYLYANSEDVTLTFTGTAYNGNGEVPLAYDEQADFPGWNLIGNPYGTNATLSQPYYRLNENGSALNASTETTAIAAMEGVFVQAATHGQTVTFTAQTRGNAVAPVALTNIKVSDKNGSVIDNAIIRYDQGSTLGKFQLDPSHSMLYIPQDGKDYAIIDAEAQGELPLNFKASENGTYTLNVNPENVKMNYLHLIDNMTGAEVDLLATPSYTFEAKTNDYASRFKLVFVCEDGFSTGSETFAFISNGKLVVMNEGQATLQVIDMMGRVLSSENLSGNAEISHSQTPGVYMLRLINGNNVKTQKIIIK